VVTRFTGSVTFVYIHLALFGAWVATNLGLVPGLGRLRGFDDGFTVLAMVASVEAIFLSTFVLISQNRMQAQADKRADLDLQVSLLAEHEITEILRMVRVMAARAGVQEAHDPALDELSQDVRPRRCCRTSRRPSGGCAPADRPRAARTPPSARGYVGAWRRSPPSAARTCASTATRAACTST
jgi:uncharacterized membrane protein